MMIWKKQSKILLYKYEYLGKYIWNKKMFILGKNLLVLET